MGGKSGLILSNLFIIKKRAYLDPLTYEKAPRGFPGTPTNLHAMLRHHETTPFVYWSSKICKNNP
jgi:hypothetical protein